MGYRAMRAIGIALFALLVMLQLSITSAQREPLFDESRSIIHGEFVFHDNSIHAIHDNTNDTLPAFIPQCVDSQVSGGRYAYNLRDTIIGETCSSGIYAFRRVVVTDLDDPPEIGLRRVACGIVGGVPLPFGQGCQMGQLYWSVILNGDNVRTAQMHARLNGTEAAFPNGNIPTFPVIMTTDSGGVFRSAIAINTNNGITLFTNAGNDTPVCELPSEGGHQGATIYWDTVTARLAVQKPFPSCAVVFLTP